MMFVSYDVCYLMTFVTLLRLLVTTFVALYCLSLMRFNGMSLMKFVTVPFCGLIHSVI